MKRSSIAGKGSISLCPGPFTLQHSPHPHAPAGKVQASYILHYGMGGLGVAISKLKLGMKENDTGCLNGDESPRGVRGQPQSACVNTHI